MTTDILLCIFAVSLYFSVLLLVTAFLMLDNFNLDVDPDTPYYMWDKED